MKLVYLANIGLPAQWAHEIQIMKTAEAFAAHGAEVELVVPRRLLGGQSDPFAYYNIETKFKITKLPCFDFRPGHPGAFNFWLRLLSFLFFAKLYLAFKKYDILYTREQWAGLIFKNFNFEIHVLPQPIRGWRKRVWRKANSLIATTKSLKEQLVRLGIDEGKILVASNGLDLKNFDLAISKEEARKNLSLPLDKKLALYVGSFYIHDWKGLDILLDSTKYFSDDYVFVLVGGERNELARIREKYQSQRLILAGRQPYQKIPVYLKAADVLVLPNKKGQNMSESENYTSPLKLFEYLASGRPIVASDLPSVREIVNEDSAVLVEPNDPAALAAGIKKIFSDTVLAERISQCAFQEAKKYSWQKRTELILNFIVSGTIKNA